MVVGIKLLQDNARIDIANVARTCLVGPRFFAVGWGRAADLKNRSALRVRVTPHPSM